MIISDYQVLPPWEQVRYIRQHFRKFWDNTELKTYREYKNSKKQERRDMLKKKLCELKFSSHCTEEEEAQATDDIMNAFEHLDIGIEEEEGFVDTSSTDDSNKDNQNQEGDISNGKQKRENDVSAVSNSGNRRVRTRIFRFIAFSDQKAHAVVYQCKLHGWGQHQYTFFFL